MLLFAFSLIDRSGMLGIGLPMSLLTSTSSLTLDRIFPIAFVTAFTLAAVVSPLRSF